MESILRTNNIVKKYGNKTVLNNINMNINKGDIYGFIGKNGAGKTTFMRCVLNLTNPNSGEIVFYGDKSINDVGLKVGSLIEAPGLYKNVTAYENLLRFSILYGADPSKINDLLKLVGLADTGKKKVKDFSLGMKQRLGIAISLLGDPEFLLLDEPINGLDPEGIKEIRDVIVRLNKEKGITFLISSHILSELQLVATKYGIISKGHLLKEITKEELDDECKRCIAIDTLEKEKLYDALLTLVNKENIEETEQGYKVFEEINLKALFAKLADIEITNIQTVSSTNIEDYYLSIIRGGKN